MQISKQNISKKLTQIQIFIYLGIFIFTIMTLSACSDKYYEMHKSPCACLQDIQKTST